MSIAFFDSSAAWSASAAWAAVFLASIGGFIALRQLIETRKLRVEQAQPYVVVFVEESAAASWVFDLVVKNFGATAATNIRLEVDPAPMRAAGNEVKTVVLPESIPVLVPRQEWRTLWDTTIARHESGLPERHMAVVMFNDSLGEKPYRFEFALDWKSILQRDVVTVYGSHDAAEALREIGKTLVKWNESAAGGLKVFARDGDARDQQIEQRRQEREAAEDEQAPESAADD